MADYNDYNSGHWNAAFSPAPLSGGASFVTIGSTTEGWTLETTLHEEEIHDDRFGQGVADTVQEGADYRVSGIVLNIGVVESSGMLYSQIGQGKTNDNCGLLGSSLYGSLCLTPVPGTPAASANKGIGAGNSYVFYLCAVGNSYSYLMGNRHRTIPVSFRCLPSQSQGNKAYAIIATPSGANPAYP